MSMGENDKKQSDELYKMRHSLAHILASAVQATYSEVKFGVGPVVENGFYYDIDLGDKTISEEDLSALEKKMKEIIKSAQKFNKTEKTIDEAIAWSKTTNQPYKQELLNDLKRSGTTVAKDIDTKELGLELDKTSKIDKVSFYTNGDFTDLCRGPHLDNTSQAGAFKLMRVAGAYWRGDEKKPQMQRVYGVAFKTDKELNQHLELLEEAKKRDHRKLGKELDLFVFSDLVGPGLPLYTPRGTVVIDSLNSYAQQLRKKFDFNRVTIPHITKPDLYKKSGHWDKFGDELFLVESQESSENFVLKPMNCPHHIQIFDSSPKSYRDLPVKYMETTTTYRDEKTGELHGLSRVRAISMDDSHVFAREDQIEKVVEELLSMTQELYSTLGMEVKYRLSYRDDGDTYLGDDKLWHKSQEIITKLAKKNGLKYVVEEGEAAFYGPKIDSMAVDSLGREWQVATVQLDFVQPSRFELSYITEQGEKAQPVMVHAALLGSLDRFLSVYIEHIAGKFPVWLAPEQIRIITVNQEADTTKFASKLQDQANSLGLRASIDNSNESVGKKIRNSEVQKIPYTVVVGEKEIATNQLLPRVRKDLEVQTDHKAIGIDEFLKTVSNEMASRVSKTSL